MHNDSGHKSPNPSAGFSVGEPGPFFLVVIMLLLTVPLIDYSRAFVVQQQLTHAVNAATREAGATPGQSESQLKESILNRFQARYPESAAGIKANVDFSSKNGRLTILATSRVPTWVMGFAGISTLSVGINSELATPAWPVKTPGNLASLQTFGR